MRESGTNMLVGVLPSARKTSSRRLLTMEVTPHFHVYSTMVEHRHSQIVADDI